MVTLREQANDFDAGVFIELFTLDCSEFGGGVYRWINGAAGSAPISFGGIEYTPFPIKAEGYEMNGEGPLPRPKITVSNVDGYAAGLVIAFQDIIKARVIRIRTFANFLDGAADADPSFFYGPDIYYVNQKLSHDDVEIQWELASPSDVEGVQIPGRVILKTCSRTYRKWNTQTNSFVMGTCPYAGSNYFTNRDQITSDPTKDKCSKYENGCELRFPVGTLPIHAFPTAGETRT